MQGLSDREAQERLKRYGLNAIAEPKEHPITSFLLEFWAPIPWMLEGLVLFEFLLKRPIEATFIAVANATDVAKASASIVLTRPGLGAILEMIQMSRKIYQRMLTYIFNKIIKTIVVALFLGIGLLIEKEFLATSLLLVLFLFANDFATLSIATDRVTYEEKPQRWDLHALLFAAFFFALPILGFCLLVLFLSHPYLALSQLQTLVFLTLIFVGQATLYFVRERDYFWCSMPSRWMILTSLLDISLFSFFAVKGVFMAPLPLSLIALLFGATLLFFFLLDLLKAWIFRYLFRTSSPPVTSPKTREPG
ncbi:MAG: hypothetical protein KGI80_02830 [Verrucomicrobiota bacterium]|nr:hypothetical protein [Verrucomicrobiota bacterium]